MFGGTLFSAPFDLTSLKLRRGAVPVVEGVRRSQITGAAHYAVSANGSLVYVPGPVSIDASATLAAQSRAGSTTLPQIQVVLNWFAELKQLAPDTQ